MSTVAVGCELAGYRIDALIGRGGMGVVYRGTDVRLDRPVAIKVIASDRASDPLVRRRFEREARLMAALDHPNVLPVYGAGEQDGCLFLVMRHVAGTDLAALLRAEGRLAPGRAARITDQVAQALDAAHRAGLVHRDVKPANVLLDGEHVYLSDFGLGRTVEGATRLTDSSEWLGTVDFCSPEQLRGKPTDARSDVYALGCVLHTAITGVPPLHRETAEATMLAHLGEEPPAPSASGGIPASFDPVLARALAKEPDGRYTTAGELGRAALLAAGPAGPAGPAGARRRPATGTGMPPRRGEGAPTATWLDLRPPRESAREPRPRRRVRRAFLAGVAGLLCVAGAAVAFALSSGGPRPSGPLSASEITAAVRSFAAAYGDADGQTLARLLAPDVTSVAPDAVERGRSAVLTQYQAQFADGAVSGYGIGNVQTQAGWVGRASAQYTVFRDGRPSVTGEVVFGIERVNGRPMIGLIATQP